MTQKRSLPDKYYGENGIHRVPLWRIAGFALNNTATNLYMMLMSYVAYYFMGFMGIATVMASSIAMFMRIWDGVTDPIIGMVVDKTDGKFGKNRPFIVIGQIILCVTSFIMFHLVAKLPDGARFPVFLVVEAIYYIGYTFQCVVTKSAQTCLTNDPKQRPLFSMFDGVYNTIVFTLLAVVFTNVSGLAKNQTYDANGELVAMQSGFFSQGTWNDLWLIIAIASACCTAIAVISIWPKDNREFFGAGKAPVKIGLKDYWDTIKGNKALQMLIVSASSDKLASTMKTSTITIILFGVIAGNYNINSGLSAMTSIPGAILCMLCVGTLATTLGQRKAMLYGSWAGIGLNVAMILLWTFGDPTSMVSADGGLAMVGFTWAYIVLYVLNAGAQGVSGNIVIPMTADCADYEVYRTGKYVPGLMGTIFSLVDKLISSFAPLLTGVALAAIGFTQTMPDRNATLAQIVADGNTYLGQTINVAAVKPVALACAYGTVIIGLICNVVALHFYPLTKEYMAEIQDKIAEIKAKAAAE